MVDFNPVMSKNEQFPHSYTCVKAHTHTPNEGKEGKGIEGRWGGGGEVNNYNNQRAGFMSYSHSSSALNPNHFMGLGE